MDKFDELVFGMIFKAKAEGLDAVRCTCPAAEKYQGWDIRITVARPGLIDDENPMPKEIDPDDG